MPTTPTKLRLPRLKTVSLRNFTLYAVNPDAEFTCGDGVFCLTGANGLGKSTLLSAINFCFTGIVSEPGRNFQSMEEYYDEGKKYSNSYFRGRIAETARAEAEISLVFQVGDLVYRLKRGLFEPEELRDLTVTKVGEQTPEVETAEVSRRERQQKYEKRLAEDIGLTSFAEFVFLQLFVFTFDERRTTLFWNQRILERALYITFGLDPGMAMKVDNLRREYESADSQFRNRQYDLTRTRRFMMQLKNESQSASSNRESYDQLAAEHENLTSLLETESKVLEEVSSQLKDANRRLASLSARESAFRDEYDQYFQQGFELRPPIAQHPLLTKSLLEHTCGLCGTGGNHVVRILREKIKAPNCPLCDSLLPSTQLPKDDSSRLLVLDKELTVAKQDIRDVLKELERLRDEESKARAKTEEIQNRLAEFDKANETTLLNLRHRLAAAGGISDQLLVYQTQMDRFRGEKNAAEKKRGELKVRLNNEQSDLQRHYVGLERDFVPVFTDFAHRFLGMTMEISMIRTEMAGVNLVIDVRGTSRRQPHQLSESQRFFLDIALRMAITQFVSDPSSKGGLYIDTPEGSLDIAYEKRAGEMLARFVEPGFQVLMTANLNSSQLLIALAQNCGRSRLHLCRMTEWADLSEVQEEEQPLFEKAYSDIEAQFDSRV